MELTVTSRPREATSIGLLRNISPYLNWFDDGFYTNTHSHPTQRAQRDPLAAPPQLPGAKAWASEKKMGSRHILDTAPFSFWDDVLNDYVTPSQAQTKWMADTYQAEAGGFYPPFLIVATSTPSLPQHNGQVSPTLGGCPVIFLPPNAFPDFGAVHALPAANASGLIDRYMEDFLAGVFEIGKWQRRPEENQVGAIFQILHQFCCEPVAINFVSPSIIVELSVESLCQARTLPGVLAGRPVHYHIGSYWNEPTMRARLRNINPDDIRQHPNGDNTNYLLSGDRILGPGIRIEGRSQPSSSGIRVKNGSRIRMMIAAHAVEDSTYVSHPDGTFGDRLAEIVERYPDQDWALAELVPSVTYTNNRVFQTPVPTHLIRGEDAQHQTEWYVCDGMSTGQIAM
ncbi:hypothetical protein LZ554_004169 [Drepanopeziza brunnea f. sp. 'monogermtubi']|nr:hypothetical protein LZ554_004169 [Drepanopeziza brunnea f. sp. 'monogermtubi']